MRQVADYIKYLKSSVCRRTHRAVYSYIIIHIIISAFGVFVITSRLADDIYEGENVGDMCALLLPNFR